MSDDLRLWAVRGATNSPSNNPDTIVAATEELMRELIARNDLAIDRMVSCIFTSTHDLNAELPGAMRSVVRTLVHYYAPADHTPIHVYLGEAQELRSDLKAAQ
jgi:chorismate mutase